MIAENKTLLSAEEAYKYILTSTRKNINSRYKLVVVIGICAIIMIVLGLTIESGSTSNMILYIVFGGVFLLMAIAYSIYNVICLKNAEKKVKQKNAEICESGISYDYKFKEQSIIVVASEGTKHAKTEYKYDSVKKVMEYDTYYEVKLANYEVLYVGKDGFQDKKMEEFFRINMTKNKKKFKNKMKKTV